MILALEEFEIEIKIERVIVEMEKAKAIGVRISEPQLLPITFEKVFLMRE